MQRALFIQTKAEMPNRSANRLLPAKVWKEVSDSFHKRTPNKLIIIIMDKNPYLLDNLNTLIRRNAELGLGHVGIVTEYLGLEPEDIEVVQNYIKSLGYGCVLTTSVVHGNIFEISWDGYYE